MGRRREPETATIEGITHEGKGIASVTGKKVFVAGALPGEEVRFQRRKFRRNYDEAELLDVLRPSADRVEPRCAAYGVCGGCSLQHVGAAKQREIKFQALMDSFARIGKVTPGEWLDPVVADAWSYRRRARLAVKDVPAKGRTLVGFRERYAPYVADMTRCEVLAEPIGGMLKDLSTLVGSLSIRARVPQIEVAIADNAVGLVFRVLDEPNEKDRQALAAFGESRKLRIYLQPAGLGSVRLMYPEGDCSALRYRLDEFGVDIEFEPFDFVQVNGAINDRMVGLALEYLDVQGSDDVLDLFCGLGNFSLPIATRARSVLGIEGEESLVGRARRNASLNGLANTDFQVADLSKVDGQETWMRRHWNRVLLDPARAGAIEVVRHMGTLGPQKVVYVSCHPGTLARDAAELVNNQGYRLMAAGILDMFPHTAHVESIAVFEKK
jgi:23S rRNA (uracil1939-C5)-methyltransferase